MLARVFFAINVVVLCACQGNYPKPPRCAADGGCVRLVACRGASCRDAAAQRRADSKPRTGKVASTADTRAEDGGGDPEVDASPPTRGESASNGDKRGNASEPRAEQRPPMQQSAARDGGIRAAKGSAAVGCKDGCGECRVCGEDGETCERVTGRDDADSCSDTRSCSSTGECLYVREAQTELGSVLEWAELTQAYAQILTFSEPITIREIRLEVSCPDSDQLFPPAWIAAAEGGIPSNAIIATANILYQSPTEIHSFALLELSKMLEVPSGDAIALVVGKTDMSCIVRVNKQAPYTHGEMFEQGEDGDWTVREGSMVFQVLSSK